MSDDINFIGIEIFDLERSQYEVHKSIHNIYDTFDLNGVQVSISTSNFKGLVKLGQTK